jgi:DNA modification methylase
MIVDALKQVGAARSIVIDEDDVILAGNGVIAAAPDAGITKLRVIEADGQEIIAVRRRGLTPEQKRQLAIYDNRTAELATWNVPQLQADLDAGLDLAAFFQEDELGALFAPSDVEPTVGRTDPDDVPAERPTDIQRGDLFELGRHRLLCGDSTTATDVARLLGDAQPVLMTTDPPYGVGYNATWRVNAGVNHSTKKLGTVRNDDRVDWSPAWALFPGDVAYVWHAGLHAAEVQASLESARFKVRSQIIWAQERFALSRGDYHWHHEPCWYAVRMDGTGHWGGDRSQSTLWSIPARDDDGHGHSTQKPVECMARAIRNHEAADVYDPFSGSGTTLIACEQYGRRGLAIEIEPRYVQIAIDRWDAFTGQQARKVGQAVRA